MEHGVFTIVIGDDDAKEWLRTADSRVDDWLYQLVDSIVFHASDRLRLHAPGRIKGLVGVDLPHQPSTGAFEGTAGVTSDPSVTRRGREGGSNPADYPVFVDQGTGIYSEAESPIYATPGHVMGPIFYQGKETFFKSFKGQPGQHFSDQSFADTVAWTPGKIELAKGELYAERVSVPV